ncbi:MAG: phage holin family protein [Bacteroidetes bacterium]|jgi:putative membrane protein|nr:phage holin family protein [Bacteroidota bacterium]
MDFLLLLDIGPFSTDWIIRILANAVALAVGARLLKGVVIEDFVRALLVAVVLSLLNATLGNILDFITMPLRFLTLGLFSFVVDAALLLLAAYFMKSFTVDGFKSAFFLAIIVAIVNSLIYAILL